MNTDQSMQYSNVAPARARARRDARVVGRRVILAALLLSARLLAGETQTVIEPLPNGDFAQGLANWSVDVTPGSSIPAGSVTVVNGAARLAKGGAFLVGLEQSFAVPEGLKALRLHVTETPVFGANGDFIPEAFDVNVTGAGGFSVVATWRPGASAAANAGIAGGFSLGAGSTLTGSELRIPLDARSPGEVLTLTVSLVGASADTVATAAIDDVALEIERPVPPPPVPDRLDGCVLFRDGFETDSAAPVLPRCALGQVGDTGITACAGEPAGACPAPGLPGQDAEFGRDARAAASELAKLGAGPAGFDYTKLDLNGDPLSDSAVAWACVVDNHTGLVWEVKVDDSADPGHFDHSYTWFEPDPALDGGESGVIDGGSCGGGSCDLPGLVSAINDLRLCGATDWRVPTREELLGLVHAGRAGPALATEYFPLGQGAYWSSTPMASDPASAWMIQFDDGRIEARPKGSGLRVRLVREVR